MPFSSWSATPADNAAALSGVSIAEGMSPRFLNDAIRQLMAEIVAEAMLDTGFLIRGGRVRTSASAANRAPLVLPHGAAPTGAALEDGALWTTVAAVWARIAGATRQLATIDDLGGIASVPAGAVCAFARPTPPTGWLTCNGAAVSRTTYAQLFAAIGTTYGAGDGSTTFNLPELRGEFIRGLDSGRGIDTGRTLGSAQAASIESHVHNVTGQLYNESGNTAGNIASGGPTADPNTFNFNTAATGGAETRPRNVALLLCIKV